MQYSLTGLKKKEKRDQIVQRKQATVMKNSISTNLTLEYLIWETMEAKAITEVIATSHHDFFRSTISLSMLPIISFSKIDLLVLWRMSLKYSIYEKF